MVNKTDVFTREQQKALINSGVDCQKIFGRKRILPTKESQEMFIEVLTNTLPRISEIVGDDGLTPNRIDYGHNLIILRNLKNKKFKRNCAVCHTRLNYDQQTCPCGSMEVTLLGRPKRYKEIEVDSAFLQRFKAYIDKYNIGPDEIIFRMSRSTADRVIKELAHNVGIERMGLRQPHAHNFRHTYITRGKEVGMRDKFLQTQAGHTTSAMLSEYDHIIDKERERKKINMVVPKKNDDKT